MQKRRALLFLALSALLATAAVLTARRFVERSRAVVEAPVETTRVVVVRADVPVGSALSRTQLADVEWPRRLLPQGTFSDPGLLEGRVLRRVDQSQKLPYSKVVLQDVPVLAIDQKMEEAENGEPKLVSVVTLQVSPEQAEQLIYSSHEGRLQLALRSPADREIVPTTSVGVADVLGGRRSPAPALARKNSGLGVEVLRGATLSRKAF
jgi:Flp pilus assembly protein CpaB